MGGRKTTLKNAVEKLGWRFARSRKSDQQVDHARHDRRHDDRATETEAGSTPWSWVGFAGMYMLHRLRERLRLACSRLGVGGFWYWNRYPGARCDVEHAVFLLLLEELDQQWNWSEKYAPQPETSLTLTMSPTASIYAGICVRHPRHRGDVDEVEKRWLIETDRGDKVWQSDHGGWCCRRRTARVLKAWRISRASIIPAMAA
jgi:hypothetical protein